MRATRTQRLLPVNVYSDPLTGRKYYDVLNPKTGKLLFAYYTYEDERTGQSAYVYTDPDTGEEIHASWCQSMSSNPWRAERQFTRSELIGEIESLAIIMALKAFSRNLSVHRCLRTL